MLIEQDMMGVNMDIEKLKDRLMELSSKAEKIVKNPTEFKKLIKKITDREKLIEELTKRAKDLPLMINMLKDYFTGKYKTVPIKTIIAIVALVLYLLNPLDLIPDFIPVLGFSDDIAAIGLCLKMINDDFKQYKQWKINNISQDDIIDMQVNKAE